MAAVVRGGVRHRNGPVLVSSRGLMRNFVVGWLIAFCVVGLLALGVGVALGRGPTSSPQPATSTQPDPDAPATFSQAQAVETVATRFAATLLGDRYRAELRRRAQVTYHSPQHWTVTWEQASWTAHGPGRYAEPDNDAARDRESDAAAGS